jgi:hypothetical protein
MNNRIDGLISKLIEYKNILADGSVIPQSYEDTQCADFLYRNKEILISCDSLNTEINSFLTRAKGSKDYTLSEEETQFKVFKWIFILSILSRKEYNST